MHYIRKLSVLFTLFFCLNVRLYAQTDSLPPAFQRITAALKDFKPDTTAVPDDKITRKIIELRVLRGGFNINEAIEFKLGEEKQKKEMPPDALAKAEAYFKGEGKQKLDNAVIWIYRNNFTYRELKQLVRFQKKDAGKKMAELFPVIMLQSLAAAEMIQAGMPK